MGDHSKTGIQSSFNTGTIVGVGANIFGEGIPPKFVPSFSWGGSSGLVTHRIEEALNTAKRVMARRNIPFTSEDDSILRKVFAFSEMYR
jgi:hypothetical protein